MDCISLSLLYSLYHHIYSKKCTYAYTLLSLNNFQRGLIFNTPTSHQRNTQDQQGVDIDLKR